MCRILANLYSGTVYIWNTNDQVKPFANIDISFMDASDIQGVKTSSVLIMERVISVHDTLITSEPNFPYTAYEADSQRLTWHKKNYFLLEARHVAELGQVF